MDKQPSQLLFKVATKGLSLYLEVLSLSQMKCLRKSPKDTFLLTQMKVLLPTGQSFLFLTVMAQFIKDFQ